MTQLTIIYLVRHAESESNRRSRMGEERKSYDDPLGTHLTQDGLRQARDVAQKLAPIHFDALLSSDMHRARETAEVLSAAFHLPIEQMNSTIRERPNTEAGSDAAQRLLTFLHTIVPEHRGQTLLLVSHGALMRSFLAAIGYATPEELPNGSIVNTGYAVLETDGEIYKVLETVGIHREKPHESLTLVTPSVAFETEYLAMIREFMARDERHFNNFELAQLNFPAFVRELEDESKGIGLPPGIVPQNTYWLLKNGTRLVGEIRLRPVLTEPFEQHYGHIGYNIRPSERRKGYGERQLALLLDKARALGLKRVMLTIEGKNTASERIIVKNGGKLEWQRTSPESGEVISAYWIEL